MKNYLGFLVFILTLAFATSSYADAKKENWDFVKETDHCYIISAPEKIEMPEGKKRGDTYILVYRINKSPNAEIQVRAGYSYKKDKDIEIIIDNQITFTFHSVDNDDVSWTKNNDEDKIIYAMKKGNKLIVKGQSSRGTDTIDTYTLSGFTLAYNQLFKDC